MTLSLLFKKSRKQNHTQKSAGLKLPVKTVCYSGESADESAAGEEMTDSMHEENSVCAFCQNTFDGVVLNKLSIYTICESCKVNLDKKIFPLWVKMFFAGVIFLVIFSTFYNWRFYRGYLDVESANKAYGVKGDAFKAAEFMKKAASEVPEAKDIAEMSNYFEGIGLLLKDKSTEALKAFEGCSDMPADFHVNNLILQAEMGSGYDKKDYNLFLRSSKAFLQLDTTQAQSWGGVASAYACLYVQTNADSLKQKALYYYNRAKKIDDTSATAKEFYGRISYRLDEKQIISKAEYDKKFPNGYTSNYIK